tara:strand:+ start:998 stop:1444 length:447 start_codon:yes stop_codon:yes gene_type:complete
MNLKISQLPVSTALQGDESIVVVQSSTTKQSTVQHIVNYIVPTTIIVSSGQIVNLSDSTYAYSELIRLTWNGANGTMTLNLPSASSNVNRVMRFISNGGFAAATRVELTPTGSDTLDGISDAYVINKTYEGVQVWSDGIEWFIIQKKA